MKCIEAQQLIKPYLKKELSDRELEAWDYSREEIYEGLRDCALEYGVDPQLTEAFRA